MTNYNFNVVVKDESGNLLESAIVSIYDSTGTLLSSNSTNSSGVLASNVSLDTANNTHRIQVSKTGYTTYNNYYEIAYNDTSYYIRLPSYSSTYCTPLQVAKFVFGDTFAFSNQSKLSDATISEYILMNESNIDAFLNTSYKSNTISDEYHDLNIRGKDNEGFIGVMLNNSPLITRDSDWKIEVWDTDSYVDYITTKTEGRNEDYYIDYKLGIIYINVSDYGNHRAKITYKWGNSSVPGVIKQLCILKTALNIVDADDYIGSVSESGENKLSTKRDSYLRQIKTIEANLRNVRF